MRENHFDVDKLTTEDATVGDELGDSLGDMNDRDKYKEVIASFRHDNNSRLHQRPISNRYNQGPIDDDLDPTLERDSVTPEAKKKEKENDYAQQSRKEGDSSNILCWTQESLGHLETKQSPKHNLFKNDATGDRPTSKQANHEVSQLHSNYFNDCTNRKETMQPYNDSHAHG